MKPEILAPAGSMESLLAALRCGADAVYIGGNKFSARQNAKNFTLSEIAEAAELCHLYGSCLHVAVNTVYFNSELREFSEYIKNVISCGADAFIVQDIGAAHIIKEISPDMQLHASTQMTIHTLNGALWAKENSFSRVVLARELQKNVIEQICRSGIETECFVHGALCMCVSGQCYMSAMIGGRSANRGLCAQSCRLPFSADNRPYNALSLKDLSLVSHVQELMDIGVTSFKIEGRMKRPEYVAAAVTALKTAINGKNPDMNDLISVFSRSGFTDGYFTGNREDMFGVRSREDVVSAEKIFPKLRNYYKNPGKVSYIYFNADVKTGKEIEVTASDSENRKVTIRSAKPEKSKNREITENDIEKQFSKLGDTIYKFGALKSNIEKGLYVPLSEWNNIRREAVEKLNKKRVISNFPKYTINRNYSLKLFDNKDRIKKYRIYVSVKNQEQLRTASGNNLVNRIIIPYKLADCIAENEDKSRFIIDTERFILNEEKTAEVLKRLYDNGFRDIICSNYAYIFTSEILAEHGYNFNLHGGFGLNITNDISIDELRRMNLKSILLSPELRFSQISKMKSEIDMGIFAYGRFPLMITRNCPIKNQLGSCSRCPHFLTDRTKRRMPVYCSGGMTEIYNSEKIYLADKKEYFKNIDFILLSFIDECCGEMNRIISDYTSSNNTLPDNITNGLYLRGVK